jgi:hypothetical protein
MNEASLWARLPLDGKEPRKVVEQTIRALRTIAPSLDRARVRVNFVATSAPSILVGLARALPAATLGFAITPGSRSLTSAEFLAAIDPKKGMATFNGWLTEQLAPPAAVALVEKLVLDAAPAALRSTSVAIDVEDFRPAGAPPRLSARLGLIDLKAFKRKERFGLSVRLTMPVSESGDSEVRNALSAIAQATGLAFEESRTYVRELPSEPAAIDLDRLLAVAFSVEEAFANARARLGSEAAAWLSLPGHESAHDAAQRRIADLTAGRSEKVSFVPIAKRVLKRALADYRFVGQEGDDVSFEHDLGGGVHVRLVLTRDHGFGMGKMFHLALGVRLDGFGGVPRTHDVLDLLGRSAQWRFVYLSADELEQILDGICTRLPMVIGAFEESVRRRLIPIPERIAADIVTRGAITARQGYEEARAEAAKLLPSSPFLIGVRSIPDLALRAHLGLPATAGGRLQVHGSWYYRFGANGTADTVLVQIPSTGSAVALLLSPMPSLPAERPVGETWIDSDEAMRRAEAASNAALSENEPQTGELIMQLGTRHGPVERFPETIQLLGPHSSTFTPRWWVQDIRARIRGRCDVHVLVDAVGLPPN